MCFSMLTLWMCASCVSRPSDSVATFEPVTPFPTSRDFTILALSRNSSICCNVRADFAAVAESCASSGQGEPPIAAARTTTNSTDERHAGFILLRSEFSGILARHIIHFISSPLPVIIRYVQPLSGRRRVRADAGDGGRGPHGRAEPRPAHGRPAHGGHRRYPRRPRRADQHPPAGGHHR